ncbi:MAG: alginate O-acetyltransferase AlgX-related protein [Terriglobales bacterium]
MPNRNTILRCGYLLPRVLLLWALLDIMLRFAPPQWYTFRVHEFAMVTGRHDLGPFRTNLTYQNSHTYGDLASLGNCTACRQYRAMTVHVDSRGFVNTVASGPYDALLVGDSFGIGAEQPENATLASQISSRTGLSIYNACSPVRAISRENLMVLIDQLGMTHGTVFFELMDWSLGFFSTTQRDPGFNGYDRWSRNLEYSPLANVSRELVGRLYDGQVMPNPYSVNVVRKALPDGKPILFQLSDVQNGAADGPKLWTKYFRVLNRELRARNFRLILIFVPSKYSVYQPLLQNAAPTNKSAQFEELRKELPDVSIVNTTPALQAAAADALPSGSLVYWPDDTHWNATGVAVAADQVAYLYATGLDHATTPKMQAVSDEQLSSHHGLHHRMQSCKSNFVH